MFIQIRADVTNHFVKAVTSTARWTFANVARDELWFGIAMVQTGQPRRVVTIIGKDRGSSLLDPCQIMEQYQQSPSPHAACAAAKAEGCEHHGRHQNILR